MKNTDSKRRLKALVGLTLPAPGDQRLGLALCHALHHSGTAKHDCRVLRWRNNRHSVQGFRRAFNNKGSVYLRISDWKIAVIGNGQFQVID